MERQKSLLSNGLDWDCLVVLDACRFDIMEDMYRDYLPGGLEKVWSPG